LLKVLGCADWFTARVTTLGELDEAMKAARASKTGAYIEIIGGKMDMPPALAYAHGRLKAMYGDDGSAYPGILDRLYADRRRRSWYPPRGTRRNVPQLTLNVAFYSECP
jgi:hypothetical protein